MTGNADEEQNLVLNRLMDASVLRSGSHKITGARRGDVDLKLLINDEVTNYGLKGRPADVTSQVLADICAAAQENGMVAKIFWTEEQRTSESDVLQKDEGNLKSNVKNHVAHLFWYHKFDEPTSEVRKLLQVGLAEPKMSSRALYILVYRRLQSITELHSKDLFNVWQQCILCTWFFVFIQLPA
jgi:hypothetical protein